MTAPQYTLLFAGLCALLQTALTALVIRQRTKARVSLLDGGDQELIQRIRAHGNFVETAPMALLLLALLEMNGLAAGWILALGCLLVVGRILHAHGLMSGRVGLPRLLGMSMTLFVISVEGLVCLWMFAL